VIRESPVSNSLSVILPVKNAQATLVATVREILETAADLSERFELLIIDDGSCDATSEIAMELTRNYPQIRAICHVRSMGRQAAIRFGVQQTQGDVVLVYEERGGSPMEEIVWLWHAASPKSRFFLRPQSGHGREKTVPYLGTYPTKRRGFRMLDRRTLDPSSASARPVKPNYLARLRDFAFSD
jgi:glycosyltransferase involved in cell wall biosynthesis